MGPATANFHTGAGTRKLAQQAARAAHARVRTLIYCAAQIALMVQSVFFLFTVVILMNLLIAMMGQT